MGEKDWAYRVVAQTEAAKLCEVYAQQEWNYPPEGISVKDWQRVLDEMPSFPDRQMEAYALLGAEWAVNEAPIPVSTVEEEQ